MRAAALVLLVALAGCGSAEPSATPSAAPSPSPSPAPSVVFPPAAAQALLRASDLPQGAVTPPQPGDPPPSTVVLCSTTTAPPPTAPVRRVSLVGRQDGVLVSVEETVAVLPDEPAAVAVQQAVADHAATCLRTFEDVLPPEVGGGTTSERTEEPVPVALGGWQGLRQSSRNVFSTPQRTSRSFSQAAVVRRGNALVAVRVVQEGRQPDLAAALRPALARLDATLPAGRVEPRRTG